MRGEGRRRREPSSNRADTKQHIFFEGGTGSTVEDAIVIRGAHFDLEGTYAEFAWLAESCGRKGVDWELISHSHGKHGGRDIDTFEIKLADATPLTVYFDCTESFGKWPQPPADSVGRATPPRPEDTFS